MAARDLSDDKGKDGLVERDHRTKSNQRYSYSFGVNCGRAGNSASFRSGSRSAAWLDRHPYVSVDVSKTQRRLYVYAPPDYYSRPNKRFPCSTFGAGDTEQNWSREDRAGVILDNLIAQKKATPMLIVMVSEHYAPRGASLREEIIPFVAQQYRTVENREHRAIAGLSAGGGTTMNVGLKSLDIFMWVGAFSSGIFGGTAGGYGAYDIEKIASGCDGIPHDCPLNGDKPLKSRGKNVG